MLPFAPAALLIAFAPPTPALETARATTSPARTPADRPAAIAAETPVVKAAPFKTASRPGVVRLRSATLKRRIAEPVWQKDLNGAFALARKTEKPVLVLVGADWCQFCHKQDDETLSDATVKATLARDFVPVRLDADADAAVVEILQVDRLPHAVILSPNADLLGRTRGFHTAAQFRRALDRASAKHAAARTARSADAPATTTVR
ncbi:MAG: thioredoxin family protein [Planctomycetota bacterium]